MESGPPKVMKDAFYPVTALHGTATPPFVIPSGAEGSAVPRTFTGNAESRPATNLSSRPERTRISYHPEVATSTYAPFRREKAHEDCQRQQVRQEIWGSVVERSAVSFRFFEWHV
jgi:hypothetical protein